MEKQETVSQTAGRNSISQIAAKAILTVFLFSQMVVLCWALWHVWPDKSSSPTANGAGGVGSAVDRNPASGNTQAPVDSQGDKPVQTQKDAPKLGAEGKDQRGGDTVIGWELNEKNLLLIVMLAGALGGALHGLYSICDYIGNKQFDRAWFVWYLVRAPVGAAVATVIYLALRGGFGSMTDPKSLNLYGIAGIAALAGMFNRPAVTKLSQIADQLFTRPPSQTGALQKNAVTLTAIAPPQIIAGGVGAKVTLHGRGFVNGFMVLINGTAYNAVWKSDGEAEILLPDALIAKPGKLALVVRNPSPNGGESAAVTLNVVEKT